MEEIDKEILENIENLIVKKALQKRCADFMFNYGDGGGEERHTDSLKPGSPRRYNDAWKKPYEDHTDHSDYSDYFDYSRYKDFP